MKEKGLLYGVGFFHASQSSISNGACAIGNIELLLVPNLSFLIFYNFCNKIERSELMIKIILHGTLEEIEGVQELIDPKYDCIYSSQPYQDMKKDGEFFRIYLDYKKKEN